ncbi:adenosylhomocysteinase [Leucobacter sp. CSA2]|uniref:Adenosylhomocysteinase n=1 Tax=Leucobacter edaphi TaxID=2796472 RepID=A0A934UWH8_9MICO|nr:adenosylhomocysteinase [Leucobacter edaphi]MBK0420980.1 adenosylhomocysteinase [Leucobacter edaphi]
MAEANAFRAAARAVRAAAREGNQLLSGGVSEVRVSDPEIARSLRGILTACGVRLAQDGATGRMARDGATENAENGPDRPGFVFVDDVAAVPDSAIAAAAQARGLPPVYADPAGHSRSSRAADAESRIAWAAAGMPATAALAARLLAASARDRPRLAVSLVLEPKTAAFARTLADSGCEVAVFGAVSETDPSVATALELGGGVAVFAPTAPVDQEDAGRVDAANAAAILDWAPELLIDDGSHLLRLAHTERNGALDALRGAAEETTSGVRPLVEMVAEGSLAIPVIAVNDARTKTGFDNRIGTGQTCVTAILDLLDPPAAAGTDPRQRAVGAAGEAWTVIGYGPVGEGVARFAAAFGARVRVVERDPVRALAAHLDGHAAVSLREGLAGADVVVSATGVWHTLTAEHFAALAPGTAVAVAGGIDDELALGTLRTLGWTERRLGEDRSEWIAPGEASGPIVLADGGGVNYTAGEGNPVEIMDLSFATQLAALIRLISEDLPAGVHTVSAADEAAVARASLAARGAEAEAEVESARPGGAAQHWRTHRYGSRA